MCRQPAATLADARVRFETIEMEVHNELVSMTPLRRLLS